MRIISLTFALSFLHGCGPAAPVDMRAQDDAVIRANAIASCAATNAKDLEKTLSFYTDDAVQLSDGAPMLRGKDQLRAAWKATFAQTGTGLTFATAAVDVSKAGDLAVEHGTYDYSSTDQAGNVHHQTGKYVDEWKKQPDGTWKVAIDIDNSDAPPAPASSPAPATKTHGKSR
jgi:uncharacterized protein (TIGR02246 family)